jgi:hypothetical protein
MAPIGRGTGQDGHPTGGRDLKFLELNRQTKLIFLRMSNKTRKIIIAGNWKMNSLPQETQEFFSTLKGRAHEFIDPSYEDSFEKKKNSSRHHPSLLKS